MRPNAYCLLLILAVSLVACGGGSDSPSPRTPDVSATPALPTGPTASQTIQPQASPSAATPAPSGTIYVVRRGDTLTAIAKHFNVSLAALRAANPDITNPRLLQVGHKLVIPTN